MCSISAINFTLIIIFNLSSRLRFEDHLFTHAEMKNLNKTYIYNFLMVISWYHLKYERLNRVEDNERCTLLHASQPHVMMKWDKVLNKLH